MKVRNRISITHISIPIFHVLFQGLINLITVWVFEKGIGNRGRLKKGSTQVCVGIFSSWRKENRKARIHKYQSNYC